MPDAPLIEQPASPTSSSRASWWPAVLQVLGVLLLFAVAGAAAGWVWEKVWTPPTGLVFHHRWYPDDEGVHGMFSGTGWYVVVAVAGGLVAGVVSAFFVRARSELLALGAVVAGSLLAAWVMHRVGPALGPPDPARAAASLRDYAHVVGRLDTSGSSWWIGFPTGAVAGVAGVFLGTSGGRRRGR